MTNLEEPRGARRSKPIAVGVLALAASVAALQCARPDRRNPPVDRALALEAHAALPPEVAGLVRRACYDCHSHETRWPWYAHVAPVSWLVAADVDKGRRQLNFSRWGDYNVYVRADLVDQACRLVADRSMPLPSYRLMHSAARLTEAEIELFCEWTRREADRLVAAPPTVSPRPAPSDSGAERDAKGGSRP